MESGLAMWADHPILGVGIGNYPAVYDHYRVADVWGPNLGHAHNYFINIGAEAGAFGEAAWLLLLISSVVIGARSFRRARDPLTRAAAVGGLCVMVGFAAHMFFDDLFVHGLEVQIALVMVLATRAGYGLEPEPERGPLRVLAPIDVRSSRPR
jgi:O-antigen ligase